MRSWRGRAPASCRPSPTSSTTWASATPSPSMPTACPTTPTGSSRPSSPKARSPPPVPSALPTSRPSPPRTSPGDFGAAVGVGSVSSDGIFTRGAAAQVRDTPDGIIVPVRAGHGRPAGRRDVGEHERHRHRDRRTGRQARGLDRSRRGLVRRRRRQLHGRPGLRLRRPDPQGGPDRASRRDGRRRRQRLGRLHGARHRPAGRGGDADRRRVEYPDGGGHPLVRRMPAAQGHGDRDHRRRSHGGLRGHLEERGDGGHARRHDVDEHRGGHGRRAATGSTWPSTPTAWPISPSTTARAA